MIRDILKIIETELGQQMQPDAVRRIEARICASYSGERIPAMPKVVTIQRVIDLGTGLPNSELARRIGCSVRTVQRTKRLLCG